MRRVDCRSIVLSICLRSASGVNADEPWECLTSFAEDPPVAEAQVLPDSLRGLVIWARDDSAQATVVPSWASEIWDPSFANGIPAYFDDVANGNLKMRAVNVFGNGSNTYVTGNGGSWLTKSDVQGSTANYVQFFQSVMQRVDSVINFADFDWYGPTNGQPDNKVDFVYLMIAAKNNGLPFAYNRVYASYTSRDSVNGQPVVVSSGTWGITNYRADLNTETGCVVLSAHEWLHTLAGAPDRDHVGFTQYKHYALGSFDPLSRGGFDAGWPSPYIPSDRDGLGWDSIQILTSPSFGHVLRDQLLGVDRTVAIIPPRNVLFSGNTSQRFVVSYHGAQDENVWESGWPGRGVLVWHESKGSGPSWSYQDWRPIKLETSSGLYEWTDSVTIDSLSPNAVAGLDSLDWRLVWPDEFHDVGSANWLWGNQATDFSQVTNPSSDFHRVSGGTRPQDLISHVAIHGIQFFAAEDSAKADLLTNAWTGLLSASDSIHGPSAVIIGDLTIANGVTLTIDSGTTVYVMANDDAQKANDTTRSEIIVQGTLNALGTASKPIVFKSHKTGSDSLAWRGIQVAYNGHAEFEYCEFSDMSHGLRIDGADSVAVKHCTFDNIGDVALSVERGDSSALGDSSVTEVPATGTTIQDCEFLGGTLAGSCGIVIDSGTSAAISDVTLEGIPNAIIFRQSSGSLRDVTVEGADTAVYAAVPADSTLTLDNVFFFETDIVKGIAARSGTIVIDSSSIYSDALTALDAYTGTAKIRATNSEFFGSPTTSAAISIGPSASLYAKDCSMAFSWIGVESYGNYADSIIHCWIYGNDMYGIRLDTSDAADYTKYNHIENDAASALNIAYLINRQSVTSIGDTILGGYNWNFDFYSATLSGLKANVSGLRVKGKPGDDWGLVLNGPSSNNDSAWVEWAYVDSIFSGAHLYLYGLYADVENCTFKSVTDTINASPYGIKDVGSTTGKIRCTKALNVRTDCVYRGDSTSHISYGESGSSSTYGNNSFYVTDTLKLPYTKYFRNIRGSVTAEKNWWGKASPNANRFAGTVDYTPTLTTGPICQAGGIEKVIAEMPESEEGVLPAEFALGQNFPNPFNPATQISFQLPLEQHVCIDAFNTLGRLVRSFDLGVTAAGFHSISWDGRDHAGRPVGSGVYLYRIATPDYIETKKMLLLK